MRSEAHAAWADDSDVVVDHRDRDSTEPRAPRIEVMLWVTNESESNFYAGFTENLSECGVFVATHAPLELGSKVDLCISLSQTEPIRARGTVRWLRAYSDSNETAPGMGIRFDRLPAKEADRVNEFTKSRAPMFFDDETADSEQIVTRRP
jgi:uncharacterized protein (TIGR02266 family)